MPFPATNIRDGEDAGRTAVAMPAQPCVNELNGYCTSISPPPSATTFMARASPVAGRQRDPRCGVLIVDNTGIKPAAGTGSADDCW